MPHGNNSKIIYHNSVIFCSEYFNELMIVTNSSKIYLKCQVLAWALNIGHARYLSFFSLFMEK